MSMAAAGGQVAIDNEVIRSELAALSANHPVEVIGFDGQFFGVLVKARPLPPGRFVAEETPGMTIASGAPLNSVDVLMRLNKMYPHAAPDMFWVRPFLRLASGAVPQAAEQREGYFGETWQRFSWHLKSGWTPIQDTLVEYLAFIDRRLQQGD